jgi:hypothetical protein
MKAEFFFSGSARASRAAFGALADRISNGVRFSNAKEFPARAPETAREARALPAYEILS